MLHIEEFSKISGYKMNIEKTEIMTINKNNKNVPETLKGFNWQSKSIKYLGCYISADKKQLFKDNFLPLIDNLKQDFQKWADLPINLMGRINLFRMIWLPKFLYIFSTIPINPPKYFFTKAYSLITSFIWANKAPRLSRKLLHYPKSEGGLNLPNLEFYHLASQSYYFYHIIRNSKEEQWINIENSQTHPQNLFLYLFSKHNIKHNNFIINGMVRSWNKMKTIIKQPITIPRNTNIWNNLWITIQQKTLSWDTWKNKGIHQIDDLLKDDQILSFTDLRDKFKLTDKETFRYIQLKNWLIQNFELKEFQHKNDVVTIISESKTNSHLTKQIYKALVKSTISDSLLQNVYSKWNYDLNITDAGKKWKKNLSLTHEITTNENLRLIQYKLMSRTYYTRDKIYKFDNKLSDICLKCQSQRDSLIHSFWECCQVNKVWKDLEKWLSNVHDAPICLTPQICLFQDTGQIKYPTGWMILFSALVLKKVILKNWKDTTTLTLDNWKSLMKYYLNIEKALAEENNKIIQFNDIWSKIILALHSAT